MSLAMMAPAPVEEAALIFRTNDEPVALDIDLRVLEELFAAAGGDGQVRPGPDLDLIGARDFDLLEVSDPVVLGNGRSAAFLAAGLAARDDCRGGNDGDNGSNHGRLAH